MNENAPAGQHEWKMSWELLTIFYVVIMVLKRAGQIWLAYLWVDYPEQIFEPLWQFILGNLMILLVPAGALYGLGLAVTWGRHARDWPHWIITAHTLIALCVYLFFAAYL